MGETSREVDCWVKVVGKPSVANNIGQKNYMSQCQVQVNRNKVKVYQKKVKSRFGHELVISCSMCSNSIMMQDGLDRNWSCAAWRPGGGIILGFQIWEVEVGA